MQPARRESSWLEGALLAAGVLFVAWFFACTVGAEKEDAADDAYISYIYSRNLVEGHGLRYNATDAEPTSGASSLLHVLVVAPAIGAGLDPLAFSRALSIASLLAIGVVFGLVGSALTRAPPISGCLAGLAVVFLWGAGHDSAAHLASGMDTLMFTAVHAFAVAWAAWVVGDDRPSLGFARTALGLVVLALLSIARPEGATLAVLYVAAVAFVRRVGRGPARSALSMLPIGALLLFFLLGFALWRLSYFGHVLSNPYYVKISNAIFGSDGAWLPGAATTSRFALTRLLPACALLVALAAAVRAPNEAVRRGFWLLIPAVVVTLSYSRAIHEMAGGFRYEYPMLAPFAGALIVGLCALRQQSPASFGAVLACAVFAVPLLFASSSPPIAIWLAHPRSVATSWWPQYVSRIDALSRLGLDLAETRLEQRATILLSGAGQVPYLSRFRAIDWIGLNHEPLSGREPLSIDAMWRHIDAQAPDLVFSILPPAAPGEHGREDDVNFQSAHVQRTLDGRGSALFERWDPERIAESFWREMLWIRDRCEYATCYRLGDAWGDRWWVLVYVRRDSPHRARLMEVLSRSVLADHDDVLSDAFPFDPKSLRASP